MNLFLENMKTIFCFMNMLFLCYSETVIKNAYSGHLAAFMGFYEIDGNTAEEYLQSVVQADQCKDGELFVRISCWHQKWIKVCDLTHHRKETTTIER